MTFAKRLTKGQTKPSTLGEAAKEKGPRNVAAPEASLEYRNPREPLPRISVK
jgi:hypothetical protein